jgi:hypothetical protein
MFGLIMNVVRGIAVVFVIALILTLFAPNLLEDVGLGFVHSMVSPTAESIRKMF